MKLTDCVACGDPHLEPLLELGEQPPPNMYHFPGEPRPPTAPLALQFCRMCKHVQLAQTMEADELFRKYAYRTGASAGMVTHFARLAQHIRDTLPGGGVVLEAASGDGTLLKNFYDHGEDGRYRRRRGWTVVGIDPARNLADELNAHGIKVQCDYLTEESAETFVAEHGKADVVVACNVLAHVPDLDGFLRGVKAALKPDGVFIFEVPLLDHMVENNDFTSVYFEHISYFSLHAIQHALRRVGLRFWDLGFLPVHGGSVRGFAVQNGRSIRPAVVRALEREKGELRILDVESLREYARNANRVRAELRLKVHQMVEQQDLTTMAYGAAAKATVLLNACGFTKTELNCVFDNTPEKHGRLVPGTNVPIFPDSLLSENAPDSVPDVMLLTAWNHAAEIISKEAWLANHGMRWLTPLPVPFLVNPGGTLPVPGAHPVRYGGT